MDYILLAVVVLFVLFTAWRERENKLERESTNRLHRLQTSELLTRITHPNVALVPVNEDKASIEVADDDQETQQDDQYEMVGSIIPGLAD